MNARDDENYYRGLLESAQKGIENAKAQECAIQIITESTRKHLEQLEHEADQLWDHFKRVLRGD
jgi:hypothetical protein